MTGVTEEWAANPVGRDRHEIAMDWLVPQIKDARKLRQGKSNPDFMIGAKHYEVKIAYRNHRKLYVKEAQCAFDKGLSPHIVVLLENDGTPIAVTAYWEAPPRDEMRRLHGAPKKEAYGDGKVYTTEVWIIDVTPEMRAAAPAFMEKHRVGDLTE